MPLDDELPISFAEAAAMLPPVHGGKRTSATSVWRWARRGVFGIRLEFRAIGSRCMTSVEALQRFNAALAALSPEQRRERSAARIKPRTPALSVPPTRHRRRSNATRERAVARSQKRLESVGA